MFNLLKKKDDCIFQREEIEFMVDMMSIDTIKSFKDFKVYNDYTNAYGTIEYIKANRSYHSKFQEEVALYNSTRTNENMFYFDNKKTIEWYKVKLQKGYENINEFFEYINKTVIVPEKNMNYFGDLFNFNKSDIDKRKEELQFKEIIRRGIYDKYKRLNKPKGFMDYISRFFEYEAPKKNSFEIYFLDEILKEIKGRGL